MRVHGSSATVISANCPAGALDSGGRHSPKIKHNYSKEFPLRRAAAHGIIVPLLYTADDAKKLVTAAKFPPAGNRGFGSPFPMEKFGSQTSTEVSLPFLSFPFLSFPSFFVFTQSEPQDYNASSNCLSGRAALRRKTDFEISIVSAAGK